MREPVVRYKTIVAADGWYAVYSDDEEPGYFTMPVMCWGLRDGTSIKDGGHDYVTGLTLEHYETSEADDISTFMEYVRESDMTEEWHEQMKVSGAKRVAELRAKREAAS